MSDEVPVSELDRVVYVRASVPCLLYPICGNDAEFVWRADQWPPPAKYRKRRCKQCATAERCRKGQAKAEKWRRQIAAAKAAGRMSAERSFAREERKRRARWRTVPASLRQKDSTNGA